MKKFLLIMAFAGLCFSTANAQKKPVIVHKTCNESTNRRTEIILPQVKGYNCYKGDFHVHTAYSDGVVTPAGRVSEAWYDGLDIIAITDHLEGHSGVRRFFKVTAPYNKNGKPTRYVAAGSSKMPKDGKDPGVKINFNAIHKEAESANAKNGYGLLLVKGCEMARNSLKLGHFNALFVEDLNAVYNFDIREAFKNVKKQGGIVIHNHPGNVANYETDWHHSARQEGLISGIELANGYSFYPQMLDRCVNEKLTMFGNTDTHGVTAHRYATTGHFRTMTIVLAKELTQEAIKDAILKRRTIVYSGGDLIGEESWLTEFLNASIDCRMIKEDKEKGSRTFLLTNTSSIPYRFRRGKSIYELAPFKSMSLSFGKDKKSGKYTQPKLSVENMWITGYKHPVIEFKTDK
jgi:hypothetical protein